MKYIYNKIILGEEAFLSQVKSLNSESKKTTF